jgi:hypothetical protein
MNVVRLDPPFLMTTSYRSRLVRIGLAVAVMAAAIPILVMGSPRAEAATDPVIAAVGDTACDPANPGFNGGDGDATDCRQKWTADLLSPTGPVGPVDAVLPLGDEQYGCGGLSAFQQVYDPTWGQQNANAHPVPGNHEYQNSGGTGCPAQHDASGYYSYFGALAGDPAKGYYSFNLGAWHIIALNSELCYDQTNYDNTATSLCPSGSPMETWLRNDLAANAGTCKLAYWHEPRFSSTPGKGDDTVDPLWQDMAAAKVDVVLNGHQHFYERFAQMSGSGLADPNGVREFIVGTGGESFMPLSNRLPTSQAANDKTFGVLKMTLHAASYEWQFVPIAGSTFTDSGSTDCHPLQTDRTPPTTTIACNGSACSGGWYGANPVSVSLSTTDSGGSGLAGTRYTTDGTDPATSSTAVTYTGPFTLASTATVRYFSTDRAGNVETTRSQLIQVDTAAPTTVIACDGADCLSSYPDAVTVSLSATDAGGSGVAATRYTTDGTDPATSPTAVPYISPFGVGTTSVVKFFSRDLAGNVESTGSRAIQIGSPPVDTVPPATSIACNGTACSSGWYGLNPVSVTLSAIDAGGSGVARTRYTTDGSDPATSSTATTYTGAFLVGSTASVRFASADNAGNVEPANSQLIQVDTRTPTTSASCNGAPCASGWYRASVSVSLSATDTGGSGVATTLYTLDGSDPASSPTAVAYTGAVTVTSTATVKFSSKDVAGNAEQTDAQPVQIDTIAPTTPIYCNGDPCGSDLYGSPVAVTLPATDAGGSGLARTVYTTDGTDPATSPTAKVYLGAFSITQTTTVKAFSVDNAGNVETTGTQLIQVGSGGGANGSVTLSPTDDSYAAKGNPAATHGTERSVDVNSGTSERRAYVKFSVAGIPAGAIGITATLKLYSQSSASSSVTFSVSRVATSWSEATLTWNNQPALGAVVTTKAGLTDGAYNNFDVSSFVTGNGTYAMVVTDNNTTQRYFSSKESSSEAPRLVVSWTVPTS